MERIMPKNQNPLKYMEVKSRLTSYLPVNRNGWWIKFSVFDSENILLIFTSMFTGQTAVRHFTDEEDAVAFINFLTECDPSEDINP
jgi:hypothetical protein